MLQRIRESCKIGDLPMLSGIVEIDETYIGGSLANMKPSKKKKYTDGMETWYNQKGVVLGMKSRDTGEIRLKKINKARKMDILPI